ncbi:MAG: class II aldolase/adducin family protein [Pseudomonadota bacterium]
MATAIKTDNQMSTDEREARKLLASCYRVFAMLGWDEMIYNHITLKVPGEEDAFLINPYGLHFSEVCASNLVKINSDGETLDGSLYPVNKAGFVQHSMFHRELPDMHCIIHTHTTATMAVCSVEGGLQPTNFYACNFVGQIGYHDFEGVTVREEEGPRLAAALGDKRVLMLRNHGPVVMGRTLPEAFITYWALQRACEIQLATASMGAPIVVPQEVVDVHQRDISQTQLPTGPGVPDFAAMVRLVDKIDTSWRD